MESLSNNYNKKKTKKTRRYYLLPDKILDYFNSNVSIEFRNKLQDNRKRDFTEKFLFDTTPIYDEWLRMSNELKLWISYTKLNEESNFWPREILNRVKDKHNMTKVKQFVAKKINYFNSKCCEFEDMIRDLEIKYNKSWQTIGTHRQESQTQINVTRTNADTLARNKFDLTNMEKEVSNYINKHIKHVLKNCEIRYTIALAEKDEYQALKAFEAIAKTKPIYNIHLSLLKPNLRRWATKVKEVRISEKRIQYNLLPKFIMKNDFTIKYDKKSFEQDRILAIDNGIQELTNVIRRDTMKFYFNTISEDMNNVKNEIDIILNNCQPKNPLLDQQIIINEDSNGQPLSQENNDTIFNEDLKCFKAMENYYQLAQKRIELQAEQACNFLEEEAIEIKIDKVIVCHQQQLPPTTITTTTNMDY